jgi:hypothetical protein
MLSQLELDTAPKVTLAGKEYPIPLLAPRQNRIVIPKLIELMKAFTEGGALSALNITMKLTTQQYDDLSEIIWVALTRGTPSLAKDDFLDMSIDLMELIAAMDIVAQQCGVMKRAGEAKPGEAKAVTVSPIGTGSSPE